MAMEGRRERRDAGTVPESVTLSLAQTYDSCPGNSLSSSVGEYLIHNQNRWRLHWSRPDLVQIRIG
jgi:hypothetical protein